MLQQFLITPLFPLLLLLLLLSIFLAKFIFLSSKADNSKHKNLPPGPPRLPVLGNLHQLGTYPHRTLHSLSHSYGQIMRLQLGSIPCMVASSADVAKEIMKTHDLIFSDRLQSSISDVLLYKSTDVASASYGEYWRQMRSICVLHLLSNRRVQSFQSVREEEVDALVKKIEEFSSLSLPVDLSDLFGRLTNDIICRVALGRKYNEEGFKKLLAKFMAFLGSYRTVDLVPWLGWVNFLNRFGARMARTAEEFDVFLDRVLEEHLQNMERSRGGLGEEEHEQVMDFVDVLLQFQKDNTVGFSITRDNIKALILDMFAAGTDTSYTVLEWAMTKLLRHPRVMKELQNEVRKIVADKQRITESDLAKMHYLKAVIKETLRLYPPIPLLVPRKSTQDVKIKGYNVDAGTIMFVNAWAIGRDPKTWDDPEEFRPERFLNSSIDFKGHDFELIPFGAGRRGCPGAAFAMANNELVLANVIDKFEWTLPPGVKDLDMTQCSGLVIHRKVPLCLLATPRLH